MQKKKRFLALLLALVVALPFIQSPLTAQAAGEGSVTRKITVVKGKDINDIQYDGKNVLHSSAWWYDEVGQKIRHFVLIQSSPVPVRLLLESMTLMEQ